MANTQRPDNSIFVNTLNGLSLPAGDGLIVDPGIMIATSAADGYGVNGAGGNTVICNGSIGADFAVVMYNFTKLTVGASGTISGSKFGVYADSTANGLFDNDGRVFGSQVGAYLSGKATLINDGVIQSGMGTYGSINAGVYLDGSGGMKVTNNGTISAKLAGGYAIYASNGGFNAVDNITNNGVLIGNVALSDGNDTFNGLKGRVYGTIDGGAGKDTITGSVYADTLHGGTESDTFYFKTKADNHAIDHIQDFVHGEDHIGLSRSLFKLDPGQTVADAFQDITTGLNKQGADKHILYNHNSGWLYYDADGKGGLAPVHFVTLDTHPTITAGDILMV